jgi:hypothetical protein
VHVDVDQVARGLHEQEGLAAALAGAGRPVALAQGLGERAVAHGTAVDEQPDHGARGGTDVGTSHEPNDARPIHTAFDRYELVECGGSQNLKKPVA